LQLNKAGVAITKLLKEEFVTKATVHPGYATTIRGFHGNYSVNVYYDGKLIGSSSAYLFKGKDLQLNVDVFPHE
jgi:hypothetical protein